MPVAFTVIGSTLDATVVDGNFDVLRSYLLEQIVNGDINPGEIDKYVVRNYSAGRIASANVRAEKILDSFRAKEEREKSWHEVTHTYDFVDPDGGFQLNNMTMELLGRPGPSFYWQFQEDGIIYANDPDVNRYHKSFCYSHWLTVPSATIKVYVPFPCIVRMHGRAYYLGNVSAVGEYILNTSLGLADWDINYRTKGRQIAMRLGLFVDENPNLTTEWTNANPNILDPVTGLQAPNVSWFQVAEKSVHSPLWQRECISGETVLEGGKWYNFSMKYRGAGAVGYRVAGADPFVDGIFEYAQALPNYVGGTHQPMCAVPPIEMRWISRSLHLEFIYGYNQIYDDTANIGVAP